ncbi:MAG: signal peptidase I [Clostridia bacterium]|jgi:signal peptidase I|nr:signal peptidase I [Clostridia bacterium]MBR0438760.1 signal peptidase I [Clostridia bacterium]MBR6821562.1 signal peptidase I [Clostridia bacterium]
MEIDIFQKEKDRMWDRLTILYVVALILIKIFMMDIMYVDGESMLPTYQEGQFVGVNKTAFWLTEPEVGDVVIARSLSSNKVVIKRLAGVPGTTITLRTGQEYTLKENEYFLRGDNRAISLDSDTYGPITRDRILGMVIPQRENMNKMYIDLP